MIFQRVATELLFHHVLPFPARRAGRPLFSFGRRQVRAHAFENFGRHANRLRERRVRVNGLADVDRISTHLDAETYLADQIAGVRAHNAAADETVCRLIEQ